MNIIIIIIGNLESHREAPVPRDTFNLIDINIDYVMKCLVNFCVN